MSRRDSAAGSDDDDEDRGAVINRTDMALVATGVRRSTARLATQATNVDKVKTARRKTKQISFETRAQVPTVI